MVVSEREGRFRFAARKLVESAEKGDLRIVSLDALINHRNRDTELVDRALEKLIELKLLTYDVKGSWDIQAKLSPGQIGRASCRERV